MRAGRMTPGQQRGWDEGFPQYGLSAEQGALDWDGQFGASGRRIVEIGFGMGDSLIQMAQADRAIHRDRGTSPRCWPVVVASAG